MAFITTTSVGTKGERASNVGTPVLRRLRKRNELKTSAPLCCEERASNKRTHRGAREKQKNKKRRAPDLSRKPGQSQNQNSGSLMLVSYPPPVNKSLNGAVPGSLGKVYLQTRSRQGKSAAVALAAANNVMPVPEQERKSFNFSHTFSYETYRAETHDDRDSITWNDGGFNKHYHWNLLKRNKYIPSMMPSPHELTVPLMTASRSITAEAGRVRLYTVPPIRRLYTVLVPPLGHFQRPEELAPPPSPPKATANVVKVVNDLYYCFRAVQKLTEGNYRRLFDRMWAEVRLEDLLMGAEIAECKEALFGYFDIIRLFFCYVGGQKSPFEQISLNEWLAFCKDIRLFGSSFSSKDAQLVFLRVNVEEVAKKEDDPKGGINLQSDELNPDQAFILGEFAEALIRVALSLYSKSMPSLLPSQKFVRLMQDHLLKYGPGSAKCSSGEAVDVFVLREALKEPDTQEIYAKYVKMLRALFDGFSKPDTKGREDEDRMALFALEKMFKFCGVLNPPLNMRQLGVALMMSRDENKLNDSYDLRYPSFLELLARCAVVKFNGPSLGMSLERTVGDSKPQLSLAQCCDALFEQLCAVKPPKPKQAPRIRAAPLLQKAE